MSEFLVCPYDDAILATLSGKSVVFRVKAIEDLRGVPARAHDHSVHIHCIVCSVPTLAGVPLECIEPDLPVALYASRLGSFPSLLPMLSVLRRANIRVYLPLTHADRFSELRILSSLGVHTAGVFRSETEDWERVTDLMTYALLGRASHAPIYPFNYFAAQYHPQHRHNWAAVYFDDPETYVHMDAKGRVALQSGDVENERFLDLDVAHLTDLPRHADFLEWRERWKTHFLENDPCSRCPGWRACGGLFASHRAGGGCQAFFTELLDCAEQYQARPHPRLGREDIWQP